VVSAPFDDERDRLKRVLLVEPDPGFWAVLDRSVRTLARVEPVPDFQKGRARLRDAWVFQTPFDLLVTNMRLGSYNGLHLVHLTASTGLPTRSVVYTNLLNVEWAHEVRRAGAFYETEPRLPYLLPAYLLARLPDADRRQATLAERRSNFRGGRRGSDVPLAAPPGLTSV
jgi:DNA-binding NtrC family response regulator